MKSKMKMPCPKTAMTTAKAMADAHRTQHSGMTRVVKKK